MASDIQPVGLEKKQVPTKEVYYVQIKEAIALRKTILLASKDIIQLLHRFEIFKERRKLKKEIIDGLKGKIEAINVLSKELKLDLPSVRFKDTLDTDVDINETLTIKKRVIKPKDTNSKDEEDSAINELENSLAEIEEKLQEMMK